MFRHKIGWRKKSTQASQYRVGRYGLTDAAAPSVTSTSLVMRAARAPSAAPRAESVTVDRNSAIAPTPSMDTPMNAIAPAALQRGRGDTGRAETTAWTAIAHGGRL